MGKPRAHTTHTKHTHTHTHINTHIKGACLGEDIVLKRGTRRYIGTTTTFVDCLTLTGKDLYAVLENSAFAAQTALVSDQEHAYVCARGGGE